MTYYVDSNALTSVFCVCLLDHTSNIINWNGIGTTFPAFFNKLFMLYIYCANTAYRCMVNRLDQSHVIFLSSMFELRL